MAERKALVHYFPPDFDPAKIPRRKLGADRQIEVRLMAPFSMRCNTCGEYIYKGKKFNARCVYTGMAPGLTMQEGGTSASALARR